MLAENLTLDMLMSKELFMRARIGSVLSRFSSIFKGIVAECDRVIYCEKDPNNLLNIVLANSEVARLIVEASHLQAEKACQGGWTASEEMYLQRAHLINTMFARRAGNDVLLEMDS